MSHRAERLAEMIKVEVSNLIQEELKDPRIGFATITGVDVSGDLQFAKIHVSVMGENKEQKSTMAALNSAKGFIRRELGRSIRLRHVPDITFVLDESIAYGAKMAKLINELKVPHE